MSMALYFYQNIDSLNQFHQVIDSLSDEQYSEFDDKVFNSSVGRHTRHVLDHYEAFVRGLDKGAINYDDRDRETELELSRVAAKARITDLCRRLHQRLQTSSYGVVEIVLDLPQYQGESPRLQPTSVIRELAFVLSHSIHHYAIIACMCKFRNFSRVPAGFGVAPATLSYQQHLSQAM